MPPAATGYRLEVRWYDPRRDRDQLVGLYRACFPEEGWTADDFAAFANKLPARNGPARTNCVKVLIDRGETLYGSLLYTLTRKECRIRRLAVRPDKRRLGFGTFMLAAMLWGMNGRRVAVAKVSEQFWEMQALLRSMSFEFDPAAERTRRGDGREVYVFRYTKTGR